MMNYVEIFEHIPPPPNTHKWMYMCTHGFVLARTSDSGWIHFMAENLMLYHTYCHSTSNKTHSSCGRVHNPYDCGIIPVQNCALHYLHWHPAGIMYLPTEVTGVYSICGNYEILSHSKSKWMCRRKPEKMFDKLEKFIGVWRLLQLLSQIEMGVWILRHKHKNWKFSTLRDLMMYTMHAMFWRKNDMWRL